LGSTALRLTLRQAGWCLLLMARGHSGMLGGRPTPLPVAGRFERGFMHIGYAPQAPSDRAYWQLDGILVGPGGAA
jgi:hypothetical protein